jgi:uridine phosphorylase
MQHFSETDLILNKDGSVYHLNLKPENVADTILLVGDPGHVHKVSRHFEKVEFEMNQREFITHTGYIGKKRLTVLSTGMGMDNIEIAMIEIDALFNIDLKKRKPKNKPTSVQFIRIGASGAIHENIDVGTHLISEYAVGLGNLMSFYDLKQTEEENAINQILHQKFRFPFESYCVKRSDNLNRLFEENLQRGVTITTPGFYAPQGRSIRVPTKYANFLDELIYLHASNFWFTNFEMETAAIYAMSRLLGHEAISLNAIIANRMKKTFAKDPNKVIDELILNTLKKLTETE